MVKSTHRCKPSLGTRVVGSLWGLLTLAVYWPMHLWWRLFAHRARPSDAGIEIYSGIRGAISKHPWSEVSEMREVGYGPMTCPELSLVDGRKFLLRLERWDELAAIVASHRVPVHSPWR